MRRHRHNLEPEQKLRLLAYLAERPAFDAIYRFKQRLCYLLLKKHRRASGAKSWSRVSCAPSSNCASPDWRSSCHAGRLPAARAGAVCLTGFGIGVAPAIGVEPWFDGGRDRTRTCDLLRVKQAAMTRYPFAFYHFQPLSSLGVHMESKWSPNSSLTPLTTTGIMDSISFRKYPTCLLTVGRMVWMGR